MSTDEFNLGGNLCGALVAICLQGNEKCLKAIARVVEMRDRFMQTLARQTCGEFLEFTKGSCGLVGLLGSL